MLMLSALVVQGMPLDLGDEPSAWRPLVLVGNIFAGLSPDVQTSIHGLACSVHLGTVLWFLVFIVYSKHLHIFTAPINVFSYDLTPKGRMESILRH